MKKNLLYRIAILLAAVGLLLLLAVIGSGAAYPDLRFRIGAPLGLSLIFASLLLLFICWVWEIHDGIKGKQYLWAAVLAILGCIVIVRILIRL